MSVCISVGERENEVEKGCVSVLLVVLLSLLLLLLLLLLFSTLLCISDCERES